MKRIPHTFSIVFALIVLAAILTWVVPAGEFTRQMVDGREVVVQDSFHRVDSSPQTWQIFSAFYKGFVDKADIIIFILVVGGAFWILNNSHAIDMGVMAFLRRVRRLSHHRVMRVLGVDNIIITLVMIMFSLFGAVFGMSEETLAFVVVFIPLAIQMGYDSIVGVCMCYVAAHVGFAGAMLNPFTIGIAQGLAGLPLFSGLEYRLLCWVVLTAISVVFVLVYAHRVKRYPESSPVYKLDNYWRQPLESNTETSFVQKKSSLAAWILYALLSVVLVYVAVKYPQTELGTQVSTIKMTLLPIVAGLFILIGYFMVRKGSHWFILHLLLFTVVYLVIGVLGYGWYIMEIASLFLAMGIASGVADGQSMDQIAKLFLAGCKDIMTAALVVGLASGIIFILKDGKIIDTMLYALCRGLAHTGEVTTLGAMYLFQTLLNIVMPSGSAKAALTMPIMTQLADLIHISRQSTVLAFQFGDGFTNMITPTSGILIGVLGIAKIPYGTWIRFIWKFILAMIIIGFILMLPTLWLSIPGF